MNIGELKNSEYHLEQVKIKEIMFALPMPFCLFFKIHFT